MKNIITKENLLKIITEQVINQLEEESLLNVHKTAPYVPVSISARHIHLQEKHIQILFGERYELTKLRNLSQPNQYACEEQVTIEGPRGQIDRVRILGPLRKQTQVEITASDARKIGVSPPVRSSGNLQGSSMITIIGPKGRVNLNEGCIIADRHIHMTSIDAEEYKVRDKQKVFVEVPGSKGGIMREVTIRVSDNYALDMHIDTDDANAFGLYGNEFLKIIPETGDDDYGYRESN